MRGTDKNLIDNYYKESEVNVELSTRYYMKIIQVMPEFGLGGAETMCENLTYELMKLGHTVIVISMYDYHSAITERMETAGIDIRYLNKKPGLDFSIIIKIRKIFCREKPDVVHTHRYVMQYAIPASIMTGVKCKVHTVHNVAHKENSRIARKLNHLFFKYLHVVPVALSQLIQDTIIEEYKMKKEDIPIIFNGIDLSKCIPKDDYEVNDTFKILHIGRFSEQKNHKGLLETFNRVHQEYPNTVLQLIGDGEKKQEIEAYVANNGLTDCVEFLGLQSNVYPYLHDVDIFTLPSLYEGLPMTLIEAMGTGLPIVASAVGGVPDMITNGESGILCNHNEDSIYDSIIKLIEEEDLRKMCGVNTLNSVEKFSSVTMANSYKCVYEWRQR